MKKIVFLILLFTNIGCYGQQTDEDSKKTVLEKVNKFFVALEKQDTVLYKSLVFTNGQIWVMRKQADSVKQSMRTFDDDFKKFNPQVIIQEKPLTYEIKVHGDVAIVWAPYTLSLSGKFSHCGIDVFTLIKIKEDWKIVNATYTVEPDGCAAIKKEYQIN
jgi:hypothetical protein